MFRALLKTLLLPPALPFLTAAFALICWIRWPRFARLLLFASLATLWLLSLPVVGNNLLAWLERDYVPLTVVPLTGVPQTGVPLAEASLTDAPLTGERVVLPAGQRVQSAQAIVVLGGGRKTGAREYGGDTVNDRTLARLRYGARLHRQTQLPVLVTGGRVFETERQAEADLMAGVLREEFGVPVEWLETRSRTTAENARFSAELLQREGVATVLLVTHAWHMPRAQWVFETAGLKVVPAPMGFTAALEDPQSSVASGPDLLSWLPSAGALQSSHWALHEWLGGWVYRWTESR